MVGSLTLHGLWDIALKHVSLVVNSRAFVIVMSEPKDNHESHERHDEHEKNESRDNHVEKGIQDIPSIQAIDDVSKSRAGETSMEAETCKLSYFAVRRRAAPAGSISAAP